MASRSELAAVLKSRQFRRLFSVRLSGQFFDGFFQSALATFVLFSPERQPSAASIAIAFATLYLPYTLIGPFAGVLLDRWRRRQVLLYANLVRAVTVILVAALVLAEHDGVDLAITVLVVLGINRFILAGLSAALPHTVEDEALVTANALSPTIGTLVYAIGILVGVSFQRIIGGGDHASTVVLALTVLGFAASGLLATRMPKNSLGPEGDKPADTFAGVLRGLAEGAHVVWDARPAYRSIMATTISRAAFGIATVQVIVLVRNTLNSPTEPEKALSQISVVVGGATIGALVAALITPALTRRFGPVIYSCAILLIAGVIATVTISVQTLPAFIVAGVVFGLSNQGTKICADTITQQQVADDHLGRAFSLYDIAVNVGIVVGVTFAAIVIPASGESLVALTGIAILLIGGTIWYFSQRNNPKFQIIA